MTFFLLNKRETNYNIKIETKITMSDNTWSCACGKVRSMDIKKCIDCNTTKYSWGWRCCNVNHSRVNETCSICHTDRSDKQPTRCSRCGNNDYFDKMVGWCLDCMSATMKKQ